VGGGRQVVQGARSSPSSCIRGRRSERRDVMEEVAGR
jgi:hypothetical protein